MLKTRPRSNNRGDGFRRNIDKALLRVHNDIYIANTMYTHDVKADDDLSEVYGKIKDPIKLSSVLCGRKIN